MDIYKLRDNIVANVRRYITFILQRRPLAPVTISTVYSKASPIADLKYLRVSIYIQFRQPQYFVCLRLLCTREKHGSFITKRAGHIC